MEEHRVAGLIPGGDEEIVGWEVVEDEEGHDHAFFGILSLLDPMHGESFQSRWRRGTNRS